MNGATGTPRVTMIVQMPMYRALSLWKKVSATTPDPMAAAGQMKKAVMARQRPMVAYEWLFAHPMLPTRLQTSEMRKMGRRP